MVVVVEMVALSWWMIEMVLVMVRDGWWSWQAEVVHVASGRVVPSVPTCHVTLEITKIRKMRTHLCVCCLYILLVKWRVGSSTHRCGRALS